MTDVESTTGAWATLGGGELLLAHMGGVLGYDDMWEVRSYYGNQVKPRMGDVPDGWFVMGIGLDYRVRWGQLGWSCFMLFCRRLPKSQEPHLYRGIDGGSLGKACLRNAGASRRWM